MLAELVPIRSIYAFHSMAQRYLQKKYHFYSIRQENLSQSVELKKLSLIKSKLNVLRDFFLSYAMIFFDGIIPPSVYLLQRVGLRVTSFWTCPDYLGPRCLFFSKQCIFCIGSNNNRMSIWSTLLPVLRLKKNVGFRARQCLDEILIQIFTSSVTLDTLLNLSSIS